MTLRHMGLSIDYRGEAVYGLSTFDVEGYNDVNIFDISKTVIRLSCIALSKTAFAFDLLINRTAVNIYLFAMSSEIN